MTINILVRDPKFWTAVLFLIQTALFFFVPEFPTQLWEALSGVLVIVFATLATRTTVQTVRALRELGLDDNA